MSETEDHTSEDTNLSNSSDPEISENETRETPEADESPSSETTPAMRPEMGQDDDPLPEWEELSPELMEDECIRGDFMLKWAVLLLSVLLGWVYVTESNILVQIRTGEYITNHGFLPPAMDVFSSTATDRRWVNLNWLSDVALSMVHQFAGMAGLSAVCALSVGGAFWFLSRISLPKVSTWWASICCVLGLVACFPMIQPGPTGFTILFLAAMLWLMFQWQEEPNSKALWSFPLLFLLWSNTSEEAIFGLMLAGMYIILRGVQTKEAPTHWGAILATTAFCGIVIHPFIGGPLQGIAFARLEAIEAQAYGGVTEHFSYLMYGMSAKEFWTVQSLFTVAAVALLVVSFLTLFLNISRQNWGLTAVWFGANALALLFGDWVGYAAIVNVAVAVLNGQEWYRDRFSMEYKIDTWSVFVARAGRAVTVLSFFGLAYVAINGILMGAEGRRIGTGLDPRWQNRIDSTGQVIEHAYSDHIFPLRPDQGDLLIWLGKKPFIDSRLSLYGTGGENLLALHREVRGALFGQGERELWYDALKKYENTDALARLWGRNPAYAPFTQLLVREDWTMTGIGAAGANFTYSDPDNAVVQKHIQEYQVGNFAAKAFREEDAKLTVSLSPTFPRPVTNYDRWLIQKLPVLSNNVQMARHYDEIRGRLLNYISPQQSSALAHLTIRYARAALFEDANEPLTYRLMSNAELQLDQIDQNLNRLGGTENVLPLRSQLALHAAYYAAQASGDDPNDLLRLFQLLLNMQKLDLALDLGNRLLAREQLNQQEEAAEQLAEMEVLIEQLGAHVAQVMEQIQTSRGEGIETPQLAGFALQAQCPKLALELLEEDLTIIAADPNLQLVYASLLMDAGRTQDALDQLEGMAQMMQQENIPPQVLQLVTQWRNITALANLSAGNASRAIELWEDDARAMSQSTLKSMIHSPFSATMTQPEQLMFPAMTARVVASSFVELPERWSVLQLQQAQAELQVGHNTQATTMLKAILEEHPEFSMRGIVVFYLSMLTGDRYEMAPPSSFIPVWEGMFSDEDPDDEPPPDKTATPPAIDNNQKATSTPPAPALPELLN